MPGSLKKGHFWGKKSKVRGLYGIFRRYDPSVVVHATFDESKQSTTIYLGA
jgi:hypothetical protein